MRYMGSKFRLAKQITDYINNIAFCENITEYYEPFMGGCSVGELVRIENRHLSDINKPLVELFKKIQEDMFEYKYVDRETWYKVKDDRDKGEKYPWWYIGWCGVACSFRGRYFEGYAGEYYDECNQKMTNQQESMYHSLLEERKLLKGIEFNHGSYNEIGDVKGAIIYCDSPYRNVKQYTKVEKFDFDKYEEWLIEKSKNNLVLISEYSMEGNNTDSFIELDKWTLTRSIGSGNTDDETSIEKLFYVKDGWLTDKYFGKANTEDYDF